MELVLVEVAHFEAVQVQVLVEGVYPALCLNLPRIKDGLFNACVAQAKDRWVVSACLVLCSILWAVRDCLLVSRAL